jgi:type I restriction enzyme S subunit
MKLLQPQTKPLQSFVLNFKYLNTFLKMEKQMNIPQLRFPEFKDKSIEIFKLSKGKLLAGLHTILARPNLEKFHIGFGGYLFKSNKVRTKIQKEAQGSKVLSISATRLTNISLDYPSKEEQKKIVECFSAIDEKIQALKNKHSLLEQYKKGVMQKLFSQELRFKMIMERNFQSGKKRS